MVKAKPLEKITSVTKDRAPEIRSDNLVSEQESSEKTEEALEEVMQVIKLMSETNLSEIDLETSKIKLSLKKFVHTSQRAPNEIISEIFPFPPARPFVSGTTKTVRESHPKPAPDANYLKIVSPMAGTFYLAPSPSSPPYVKEGDFITVGQPVCIVEAMKLMNEIKADKSGKIVKNLVANAQPVEKGTVLFWVEPKE